jgi:DNA-binding transcriptional LysR family regulator
MRQPTDATLRQLRYFAALAEVLHFGRTAASLGISQPALTRQIQTLEQFVGTPLLERTQRSVLLTAAGAAFAERARETLSNHERSLEAARNAAARDGDSLAIGFEPCAPLHDFPSVVLQFLGRYPATRLASFRMSGPEQAEALIRHRIDLGFIHPPIPNHERFIFDAVAEERFIVALPSTHRLASKKRVRIAELAQEKFVLYPRRLAPGCYDAVQRICQSAGFVPQVVHESNEISLSLTLIPILGAVTLFPECVRTQAAPGVAYRDLAGSVTTVTSGFLRRSGKAPPAISRFLRLWRTARGVSSSRP